MSDASQIVHQIREEPLKEWHAYLSRHWISYGRLRGSNLKRGGRGWGRKEGIKVTTTKNKIPLILFFPFLFSEFFGLDWHSPFQSGSSRSMDFKNYKSINQYQGDENVLTLYLKVKINKSEERFSLHKFRSSFLQYFFRLFRLRSSSKDKDMYIFIIIITIYFCFTFFFK